MFQLQLADKLLITLVIRLICLIGVKVDLKVINVSSDADLRTEGK